MNEGVSAVKVGVPAGEGVTAKTFSSVRVQAARAKTRASPTAAMPSALMVKPPVEIGNNGGDTCIIHRRVKPHCAAAPSPRQEEAARVANISIKAALGACMSPEENIVTPLDSRVYNGCG